MHISEYVCQTILEELAIFLRYKETFEKRQQPVTFLKMLLFHRCFSAIFLEQYQKKSILFKDLPVHFNNRSNSRCSVTKGVLRNFAIFTGKHLCQSLFFKKVAGLRPETLLKKRFQHRCFPVNFLKFLRTLFSQITSWRLLL